MKNKDASFLKSKDLKIGDKRFIDNKELLIKLATHYIVNEKSNKGLPVNDVSRFHLGNGAIVDDIIVNANISEVGFKRSFGVMVNYLYELNSIEKNHEDFVNNKKVNISDKLKKYLQLLKNNLINAPFNFIPNPFMEIIEKKWNN